MNRYSYRISTAEADLLGRLRPGALVNFLVQAAIDSAEELEFGFGDLKEQNLYWVLHRINIEILRPLRWGETITVETWPKDISGILYLRDFLIFGNAGEVVVRSTSAWLAVNHTSKRPSQVRTLHPERFSGLKEKHALRDLPEKLESPGAPELKRITPAWSDFDINGHVTTARYIDMMTDAMPFEFLKENYPKIMAINFLKEILPGDQIILTVKEIPQGWLFEGLKGNGAAFRGRIGTE